MKNQVIETVKPDFAKSVSVLDRLNTPIIRTCVLNLIAQIAMGTPMAAQALGNSHPALRDGEKELPLAL